MCYLLCKNSQVLNVKPEQLIKDEWWRSPMRAQMKASTFGPPICCTTASSAAVKLCWDVVWTTAEKRFAPRSRNNRARQTVKPACLREAERRFRWGGGRWRRRSKTNCSNLCAFFSALLTGSAWSHGCRRATRTSRIHSELPLLLFFACICRGYECAITNDVLTLYRANRSLRGSCRSPLVAEASEKVRGAEITATAANRNTCKIWMRLHQFDSV